LLCWTCSLLSSHRALY